VRQATQRLFFGALACCALAACSQADNDPGPGAVTVGEAKALEQAAEMLEDQRMPAEAEAAAEQTAAEAGQDPPSAE
jgi:hypothetical protein